MAPFFTDSATPTRPSTWPTGPANITVLLNIVSCYWFNLNRCYIADSKIPGAWCGLFAAMDIIKGDLGTCYLGDVLLKPSGMTGIPEYLEKDNALFRPDIVLV